ncbi:MAG: hypothetical protein CFE27_02475 [Alphaproteobacteria bacterium PA1]|nr:MAG: hypothetical protein CFE27_02475 [Alphaproteobacteria bacterium PA1]
MSSLVPQSPLSSPLAAYASAGLTGGGKERATKVALILAIACATFVARSFWWGFYLEAVLVILLSHQTAVSIVLGTSG